MNEPPTPDRTDPAALPLFQPVDPEDTAAEPDPPEASPSSSWPAPAARRLAGRAGTAPSPARAFTAEPPTGDSHPGNHGDDMGPPGPSSVPPARALRAVTANSQPAADHTFADHGPVDWALVRAIRIQVSERIREALDPTDLARGLSLARHETIARQLIDDEVAAHNARAVHAGEPPMTGTGRAGVTSAVLDSIFGLGRIEALLHLPDIEDISARGCDQVILMYADGRREMGPPVADSDEEMIVDLQHMAATNPFGERKFSPADPQLDLMLPSGDRLSASAWYTARPTFTIRRHNLRTVTLEDLVALGSIDTVLAQFLSTAIRAGISVVISGLPAAGKTTMARGLLNELDPTVALATIESEYELGLHTMVQDHPNVWPAQTIAGGEDGVGGITATQAMRNALRQSVDRVVVGEVRGGESLAMLDAMIAGKGSVSTVHAKTPKQAVDRLANLAARAGITTDLAYRMIGDSIELVLQLAVIDETPLGGRKHRFVSHVDALSLSGDAANGVAHEYLFAPGPDGRAVPTGTIPEWIDQLIDHGFDPAWLSNGEGTWTEPLVLKRPRRGRAS